MQRALGAALALAPMCALLGVFVTARRMAFFSDTISHAALVGIALGVLLGLPEPTLPILLVGLLVAAAIVWLKENTALLTDTIMALLLSGSVALGIVLLSRLRLNPGRLHGYLFGDILAIGPTGVWLAGGLSVAVLAGVFARLNALTLLTVNEEIARVTGVPVRRLNYLFVLALTVTVALSIQLLGIILVTSLLVIPPAAARNLSGNLRQQILLSLGIGLLGGAGGTMLAYVFDLPCGPAIVLTCLGWFVLSLVVGRWLAGRRSAAALP